MEEKQKTRKWIWYGLAFVLLIILGPYLPNLIANLSHEVNLGQCKRWIKDVPSRLDGRGGYWVEGWAYEKCKDQDVLFPGEIVLELTEEYGNDKYFAFTPGTISRDDALLQLAEEVEKKRASE